MKERKNKTLQKLVQVEAHLTLYTVILVPDIDYNYNPILSVSKQPVKAKVDQPLSSLTKLCGGHTHHIRRILNREDQVLMNNHKAIR